MQGLHVNAGKMNANGKDTVANSEYFRSELNNLGKNIEGLMTIWRGLSATEFNNSYLEQAENFEAFAQLLNDLGEGISQGAQILDNTENDNADAGRHLF